MDYRLVIRGIPRYYRMKVMPAETGTFRHIILAVSNVDEQITEEQRETAERQNLQSFSRIAQALAQDYFIIYYVDVETDYFIEFRAAGKFLDYGIEKRGADFFGLSRRNMELFVFNGDLPAFREIFSKENILRELDRHGSFAHTYRMMFDGVPRYVKMKVMRLDARHIVIGTSDVDAQIRREIAQTQALMKATELASRDALTGVKSKRIFVDAELAWDAEIRDGTADLFAVAVFDLNGLKTINDTMGHAAGDSYICDGCTLVCKTFQHSPVYRIGGDEFAVVLTGQDYEHRRELKESFRALNAARRAPEEAVVACGMSDYVPGRDTRFQDVFDRADADMYENKKFLKNKQ
jgi:diguanylate cyclase (GGDEF)-like protein